MRARSDLSDLSHWGWDEHFELAFAPHRDAGLVPARVSSEHQHIYRVLTGADDLLASVTGRFRHRTERRTDYPAVGDWVAVRPPDRSKGDERALVYAVLPRKSAFVRKAAGASASGQVVAANIDTVFLVSGLDSDFNVRRIERYLALAWESGARPVIVLNKADVCDDVPSRVREVEAVAKAAPIHVLSCKKDEGLDGLTPYLVPGETGALLGSSGVGKSTLINRLLGEELQRTREVREADDRGRHTTSHRQLVRLPAGALLVDTPGMREIQLWDADEGLNETFDDIETLAESCRFRDCRHVDEPGCGVKAALERGDLKADRYDSFQKLGRELSHVERRRDRQAELEQKKKSRAIHKLERNTKPRE